MWLLSTSKFFIYLSLLSPLVVTESLFYPFASGRALFFRTTIELALFIFIIFLLFNYQYWPKIKERLRQPLFLSVGAFVVIYIITSLTAVNPRLAFWSNFSRGEGGWQMFHYFIFFALTTLLITSKESWVNLLRWQALIGTFAAFSALAQPPGSFLGLSSYLATYLLLNIFFLAWLFFQEQNKFWKWFWVVAGLIQLIGIGQARARSVLIAMVFGSIIIVIFSAYYLGKKQKKYLMAFLVIFLLFLIIVGTGFWIIKARGGDLTTFWTRWQFWQSAFQGFLEKPILGWGAENFAYVYDKYYPVKNFGIEPWIDRAHNVLLDYLISGGLLLLLAYLAVFFFYYKRLLTLKIPFPENAIFFALPLVYLVNGLALFDVLSIYLMLFLFLAFFINYSLGFYSPFYKNTATAKAPLSRWLVAGMVTLTTIFLIYFTVYLPWQKGKLIIQAARSRGKTLQQSFNDYQKALDFYSPLGQGETVDQFLTFIIDALNILEKNGKTKTNKEVVESLINASLALFKQNNNYYVGFKNQYLLSLNLLKAAQFTENNRYFLLADEFIKSMVESSPQRIEYLLLQALALKLENKKGGFDQLVSYLQKLKPEIDLKNLSFPFLETIALGQEI